MDNDAFDDDHDDNDDDHDDNKFAENLFPKSDIENRSRCRKVVAATNALVVEVQSYRLAQKHVQEVDGVLKIVHA